MGNRGRDILQKAFCTKSRRKPFESVKVTHNYIQFIDHKHCVSTCIFIIRIFPIPSEKVHCYKTFRRIPPPRPDDARLILLYRGKLLLYMGREFAPSGTEVFRNHRKFPAIFTMKKGRRRMVGLNWVPLDYYSCPLPLDHGYHVLNVKKYTLINIKF